MTSHRESNRFLTHEPAVARRLVTEYGDVGAIVLECTNMPPYAAEIQRATGRAVFDVVSLVTFVHGGLVAGRPPRPV